MSTDSATAVVLVAGFILVVAMIVLGPVVTIWALNTLFALGIPTNVYTWLAVMWIHILITARGVVKK